MSIRPDVHFGYNLIHQGIATLSRIESNGIRVDRRYLMKAISSTEKEIAVIKSRMRDTPVWDLWTKRYGVKANIDSDDQLGHILFDSKEKMGLGYKSTERTASGRYKADVAALEGIDLPFIKDLIRVGKLDKALSTNFKGILRELDGDNFVHPVFNLHIARTFRSSSDNPNFQNIPVRDEDIAKLVRSCYIARDGHVLVENDFKGIEVGVSACYNRDPALIAYVKDASLDMHRDIAMELFFLSKKQMSKAIRHVAKNKFVFPQFYGSWYIACAKQIWEEIEKRDLKLTDGTPLKKHLYLNGIKGLGACDASIKPEPGTFERHVQEVERSFWDVRFKVYKQWKNKWWEEYQRRGFFDTYTGFRISGPMDRNQVINYPVQGSAFHCLLWSLVQIQKELDDRGMRTVLVGQIHDSIIADVAIDEIDDYLAIVKDVTEVRLRKHYKWINVPLSVECEICPIGGTWFNKREVVIKDDSFNWKSKDDKHNWSGSARGLINFWQKLEKEAA